MNLNHVKMFQTIILLAFCCFLTCQSAMLCEIKNGQSGAQYNINIEALSGIVMSNGSNVNNLQVFQCTCSSNSDTFSDADLKDFDRDFYKANSYDWQTSQVLRIFNCSTLSLSLKSERGSLSQALAGRLLIIENIAQLYLTQFTVGLSSSISIDDTFSSFYFRNITFYQLPAYLEFSDRHEIVFNQITTNEGSSKVEPFELRIKNTNYSRNPILRIELSRFGGIQILTDGITRNLFILSVQNLQPFNGSACFKEYKGGVYLVGNYFGFLRDKNIAITNGKDFTMENNMVEIFSGTIINMVNIKQTRVRGNIFGMQFGEPLLSLSFFKGGTSVCPIPDLQENAVLGMDFSANQVNTLSSTSYMKLDVDPSYSINFEGRIFISDLRVFSPCNCTTKNSTNVISDTYRLGQRALRDSQCIPMKGHHLVPTTMVRRLDHCSGIPATLQSSQSTQSSWLNNPYWKGNNGPQTTHHSLILILVMPIISRYL